MTRARDLADVAADATGLATDAELSSGLASKLPYSYGTATPTTSVDGFLWYDENDTPPTPKFWDGAAFQALTSGKILQIVRATDGTDRTTSSTSDVDANLSVTITPTKSTSAVLLFASYYIETPSNQQLFLSIRDSSNNAISGAQRSSYYSASGGVMQTQANFFAYATPATTSATTYKVRWRVSAGTGTLYNSLSTAQMYALEIGA